jgi:hypothetical protein
MTGQLQECRMYMCLRLKTFPENSQTTAASMPKKVIGAVPIGMAKKAPRHA